jgi:hypothetical protein
VAGRYGIAAGPAGYFNYRAASSYNRLGAAEDTLRFFPQSWLGPRYAVWFPGKSASQTASNASLIKWSVTASNSVLSFPGPTGSVAQIIAAAPPPSAPYPPYSLPIASITASSFQASYPPTNAVNGNLSDFWVSLGSNPGEGPTTNNPQWLLVTFPRRVAISRFQVYPRTTNGGYGPKDMSVLFDGASIYQGTMEPTTTLDFELPQPAYATNAELLITASYDPSYPTNSRNVQVVEMVFFERALPGTFGDWALHEFNAAQLADSSISGAGADPDGDSAPNLLEFAMGGQPLVADAENLKLQSASASGNQFAFHFRQRKDLGGLSREFLLSTDLIAWTAVAPLNVSTDQDLGDVVQLLATMSAPPQPSFYRVSFSQ